MKNEIKPPKAADRFLRWFCRADLIEEVQGDLYEFYWLECQDLPPWRAKLAYWFHVLHFFRPFALKRQFSNFNHITMYRNYFKIAFRQLTKQGSYSLIKIGGFALGIAASLLLLTFLQHELSYDQHYPETDRIYRVTIDYQEDEIIGVDFPAPFASVLKNDFPEIELAGRYATPLFLNGGSNYLRRVEATDNIYEEGFAYADQELLDILQVQMAKGNRSEALIQPNTILISESKANKYFPNEDPIGKTMIINGDETQPYQVGGVMVDFPSTSHLQFDFLFTMTGVEFWPGEQSNWCCNNYDTYVLLRPGTDAEELSRKLSAITKNYFLPYWIEQKHADAESAAASQSYHLQPVHDIYINAEIRDRLPHGDIQLIWLFMAAAMLILIIACINFVNLSTAKSANRAREVGIRKVVGALRGQLVRQFLTESILFSIFSFVGGVILAWVLLPFFNQLAARSLTFPWQETWFLQLMVFMPIIIGVLAGLYPSFYLSAFQPISTIKGELSRGTTNSLMRSLLVVFQFTASIVLIIGTFIIYQQMDFILNRDIGYDKDQVLLIQGTEMLEEKVLAFKEEVRKLPGVQSATYSNFLPVSDTRRNGNGFWKEGRTQEDRPVYGQRWNVDFDYIRTLGMKVVEGRDFLGSMPTDSQAVVINKSMVSQLNLVDPIGKRITNGGGIWQVIGVVEDFHFESIREEIYPLAMVIRNSNETLAVKVSSENMDDLLVALTGLWDRIAPHQPIRYTFLDDQYAAMYAGIKQSGRLFISFAGLAILIACLGLFGLTAFMAEQRTKEIGIRKVLGASVSSIIGLLSKNFVMLVLCSVLIAIPLAWYIMHNWLQSFAYQVELQWWVFLVSGMIALLIAFLTMSFHSVRSALMDPREAIRAE